MYRKVKKPEDFFQFSQISSRQLSKLEDLAPKIDLSPSHFSSLFKKATGMSPLNYFIHLKLQKACLLLYTTDMKIKNLAVAIGYDDPFHFLRLFKKSIDVSPEQYRGLRRKENIN